MAQDVLVRGLPPPAPANITVVMSAAGIEQIGGNNFETFPVALGPEAPDREFIFFLFSRGTGGDDVDPHTCSIDGVNVPSIFDGDKLTFSDDEWLFQIFRVALPTGGTSVTLDTPTSGTLSDRIINYASLYNAGRVYNPATSVFASVRYNPPAPANRSETQGVYDMFTGNMVTVLSNSEGQLTQTTNPEPVNAVAWVKQYLSSAASMIHKILPQVSPALAAVPYTLTIASELNQTYDGFFQMHYDAGPVESPWYSIQGGIAVPGQVKVATPALAFRSITGLLDPAAATKFIRNAANTEWIPLDVTSPPWDLVGVVEHVPIIEDNPFHAEFQFDIGALIATRDLYLIFCHVDSQATGLDFDLSVNGGVAIDPILTDVFFNATRNKWQLYKIDASALSGLLTFSLTAGGQALAETNMAALYTMNYGDLAFHSITSTFSDSDFTYDNTVTRSDEPWPFRRGRTLSVIVLACASDPPAAGAVLGAMTPLSHDGSTAVKQPPFVVEPLLFELIDGYWPIIANPTDLTPSYQATGKYDLAVSGIQIQYSEPDNVASMEFLEALQLSNATPVIASPLNLGVERYDRSILVFSAMRTNEHSSELGSESATLGGVAMNKIHEANGGPDGWATEHSVFLLEVPAGTSAELVLTRDNAFVGIDRLIHTFAIYPGINRVYDVGLSYFDTTEEQAFISTYDAFISEGPWFLAQFSFASGGGAAPVGSIVMSAVPTDPHGNVFVVDPGIGGILGCEHVGIQPDPVQSAPLATTFQWDKTTTALTDSQYSIIAIAFTSPDDAAELAAIVNPPFFPAP